MNKILIIIVMSTIFANCGRVEKHKNPAIVSTIPVIDFVTPLGLKIQINNASIIFIERMDNQFKETENCLGYKKTSSDIYIILKKGNFPCSEHPDTGCGGYYQKKDNMSIITIAETVSKLKHEYIHYFLNYHTKNPDSTHESPSFDKCS